jgi:hypothetical protein
MNRGNNLLVSGFLVALAIGVTEVMFSESEWIDRLDDGWIIILASIVMSWYLYRDHRNTGSLVPLGLLILAFTSKLIGFALEIGDPSSVGNNLGILPTNRFDADHRRFCRVEIIPWQDCETRQESGTIIYGC